jgi:secondary thiamine-phosphate synthase enzyme
MRDPLDSSAARPRVRPLHPAGVAPAAPFVVVSESFDYATEHALQFIDITEDVRGVVEASGLTTGQVSVVSAHTTAAVIVNEHEPLLLNDMARVLSRIAPAGDYYEHNDFSIRTVNMTAEECANGHAHCQHLFLGASETIIVEAGQLKLGPWQSIFLVELDHARRRSVTVQAMGLGPA